MKLSQIGLMNVAKKAYFNFLRDGMRYLTIILLFARLYLQKIFFGYFKEQDPFSILPFIFCSKLKDKLFISFKFLIIFSLIEANDVE